MPNHLNNKYSHDFEDACFEAIKYNIVDLLPVWMKQVKQINVAW